ncbi:CPBP family intramembrane glutamic endopeptidase [Pseudooceanicola nanhaiensis]|uniref:CPBP family intramembrane glutamic endopeptidase n=1 Tax=Pseudooceanicola nanhaiensis TaxID=375761 RepID=UPI0035142B17
MTPAVYAPHSAFVAPARGSNDLGRLVMGILAVEFLFGIGLSLFSHLIESAAPDLAHNVLYGLTPAGLSIQLATFGLFAGSLALVMRRAHGRPLASAIGPLGPAAANLILAAAAVSVLYLALEILPPWWSAATLQEGPGLVAWTLALPFGLAAILVQVSAEELFYRGYIQQQLAARFDSPLVWMLVPNLLFAAAHWDNGGTSEESLQYVIWALFFGLAASDLTARTGNLGAAIGLHLANNAYAFLFFGEIGAPDSGLALLLFAPEPMTEMVQAPAAPAGVLNIYLLIDVTIVWLSWLAARVAIRR